MKYLFIIYLIVVSFVIYDLYPIWNDLKWRYFLQTSFITNTTLDKHFNYLDTIMNHSGDFEGHIACSENKIAFIQNILKKYNIKTIAEIGFNAGHSSALFLHNTSIRRLLSFDLCNHTYSGKSIEYIKTTFKNRFRIVCGDSTKTIPTYSGSRYDLVFIDGGHYGNIPYLDIQNTMKYLSKKGGLLLIDDTYYSFIISKCINHNVDNAVNYYVKNNKIKWIDSIPGLSLYSV